MDDRSPDNSFKILEQFSEKINSTSIKSRFSHRIKYWNQVNARKMVFTR